MTPPDPISASPKKASGRFAALLLTVYMFMLYSRVFEASMLVGVPNLYLMLALSALALVTVIFNGGALRAARTPAGMLLIAFTLWAILILPFSSWKSESLRELVSVWLKSFAAFLIIVGLTATSASAKKAFSAIGYGAAASAVLLTLTNRYYLERATSFGSLGNSNEVAFHVAFGLPFLVLLITRVKVIFKIPLAAIALLSLALSVKTASRGGLIIVAVIVTIALIKVSFQNKFKIMALAAIGLVVGMVAVDKSQLNRYKTIFSSGESSSEALSAQASADNRKLKLQQSIDLTLAHPLTGVGMGVFIPAAAELAKQKGQPQDWLESHNSYTQISSETGLPGFLLIISVFGVALGSLLRLHGKARRLGLKDVRSMALCMLLSAIALAIHFAFDAIAYDFYLPMVAGLSMALVATAKPLIEEAQASITGAGRGTAPVPVPVASRPLPRPPASRAADLVLTPASPAKPLKSVASNPYKLGHPRKGR